MDEKIKSRFKYGLLFIAAVAIIFVILFNFYSVWGVLRGAVSIISPLIVGGCIAFILNVPMRGFEKLIARMQRKTKYKLKQRAIEFISLILTLIAVVLLIFIVGIVVFPRIADSVVSLYHTVMEGYPKLLAQIEEFGFDTSFIRDWIDKMNIEKLVETLTNNAKNIVDTLSSAASSVFSVAFNAFTGLIIAIYILSNKRTLSRQIKRLLYAFLNKKAADRICEIAKLSSDTFSGFFAGQTKECCILCLMFLVVLGIFGYPYAGVISLVIAVLAVIPYVGAFLGCAIGVLLLLMVMAPIRVLWFVVIFLVVQQIENQFVYPKVVGKSVGLPAMWTLLAALLGGKLFGIIGLLFFIPFTSVIYTILQENMRNRLKKKNIVVCEDGGKLCNYTDFVEDNTPAEEKTVSEEKED
ncbi:MAG: AI-2E family transporter [Oscillospiraceae bacterium]|nr:AI-2E family transporter [Oscillospiraceae bacterium]